LSLTAAVQMVAALSRLVHPCPSVVKMPFLGSFQRLKHFGVGAVAGECAPKLIQAGHGAHVIEFAFKLRLMGAESAQFAAHNGTDVFHMIVFSQWTQDT